MPRAPSRVGEIEHGHGRARGIEIIYDSAPARPLSDGRQIGAPADAVRLTIMAGLSMKISRCRHVYLHFALVPRSQLARPAILAIDGRR